MSELQGDTYYRLELRAHNAIGYSASSSLLMRTARGESTNTLGTLLYQSGIAAGSSISGSAMPATTATQVMLLFVMSAAVLLST